jgi:integrase
MESHLARSLRNLDLSPLPSKARLQRHRMEIDISGEVWPVEQRRLDWRDVATMHPLLLHLFKLFFIKLMEKQTADTVHKYFRRMVQVCSESLIFDDWEKVDHEALAVALETAVRSALMRLSDETVKQVRTTFVNFYNYLEEIDIPFYSSEFHAYLSEMYFSRAIPHKGVMTLDPDKGPLSRADEYMVVASLELGDGDLRDVAIVSLLHAWGLRPRQISLLNQNDLIVSGTEDFTLRVPRIKQHTGIQGDEFKLRKLTPKLGRLLKEYLDRQPTAPVVTRREEVPMFFALSADGTERISRLTTKAIAQIPREFAETHHIISPGTRKIVTLSPRRLRETFGTRCAEMPGMTKVLLAEMLDHSSTRSLEVYFDFRESIAHEMGALIAKRSGTGTLRDLTEAFMGGGVSKGAPARTEYPVRFIRNASEAKSPTPEAARLLPPELVQPKLDDIPSLGYCGGQFRCGIAPLITCYSCSDFEPWIEADHDVIVRWIDKLYERAIESGHRDDIEEFGLLKKKAEYVAERARELKLFAAAGDA